MEVGEKTNQEGAEERLGTCDLWSAKVHMIGQPKSGTVLRFNRRVPDEVAERLLFRTVQGPKGLRFNKAGFLDRQTLRNFRELTPASALEFDALLKKPT